MSASQEHTYVDVTSGPIHGWFGLTYASYLVQPRVLLQSMPIEWQERMVACLEELDAAFAHVERAPGYEVTPCDWVSPEDLTTAQMELLGITHDPVDEDNPDGSDYVYHDRAGNELDSCGDRQPVPATEALPHYRRGYVEPWSLS